MFLSRDGTFFVAEFTHKVKMIYGCAFQILIYHICCSISQLPSRGFTFSAPAFMTSYTLGFLLNFHNLGNLV